ncbi:hypothetical protein JCM8202v2_005335 [Rhodotorula sphaerocarpa]
MFVSASGAATAALAASLAISLSASTAFALPAPPAVDLGLLPRNNNHHTGPYSDVSFNITYESGRKAHLPKTLIMATGGTIAGSSESETDSTGYTAGTVGVRALVEAVPQLLNVSNIDGMQQSLGDAFALRISKLANKALCVDDAPYDAVVITHGTDTLEETAYFIDATLQCDKPVVVVGAMRPSTAISADGPNNLLQAVTTAVTPSSIGRGTLVVLNDRIASALYVSKTHANTVDTFKAPEEGFVGMLLSDKAFYYYERSRPTFKEVYDVSGVQELPPVDIFYGHQGADLELLNASIAQGAKGIIVAGTGSGSISDNGLENIHEIVSQVPVVRSTKIHNGFVVPGAYYPAILLALGRNQSEIRKEFEQPLKSFLEFDPSSAH